MAKWRVEKRRPPHEDGRRNWHIRDRKGQLRAVFNYHHNALYAADWLARREKGEKQ